MLLYICMYLPVKLRGESSECRGSPSGVSETDITATLPRRQRRGQVQVVLRGSRRDLREGVRESSARDRLLQSLGQIVLVSGGQRQDVDSGCLRLSPEGVRREESGSRSWGQAPPLESRLLSISLCSLCALFGRTSFVGLR